MHTVIELRDVPVRPALVVHTRCPFTSIGQSLGSIFREVAAWAGAHGVPLGGPAVARYTDIQSGECELDAGFAIAGTATGDARIQVAQLGGCTVAWAVHWGAYDTLGQTYDDMRQWIEEHGYETSGPMWEEYFSPPGTPPEQTRTDVYWPVRAR